MRNFSVASNLEQRLNPDLLRFRKLVARSLDFREQNVVRVRSCVIFPEGEVREPARPATPASLHDRFAKLGQPLVAQSLGNSSEALVRNAFPGTNSNGHCSPFTVDLVSFDEELDTLGSDNVDPRLNQI